jgi:hypothetical protein
MTRFTPDLFAAGLALTGAGAVAAEAAWLHMRVVAAPLGAICGAAAVPHCALCQLSLALLAAGLASLSLSILPRRVAVEA